MRLTDEGIRDRDPPKKGQEFDWDELVSGFGIRYTPTKKTFVVQWREGTGKHAKKPRKSLRPHFPQLTTKTARDMARTMLARVVGQVETAATEEFRIAIRGWFERKSETADWRPRYRTKVDALIRMYVEGDETARIRLSPTVKKAIADLGHRPVGSLSRSDVMRVADGLKRGTAEQWMAIGSSFFNDMFDRGVEVVNPFRNRLRVTGGRRVRSRTFTDAEFLVLWRALETEGDPALGAFAMLAYTGARRREVTQLRWSEVDLEAATWTLPPERRKTGKKDPEPFVIHLHPQAVEILRRQPVLEGSPYVFWGRRDQRPFDFQFAQMSRLKALGLPDWRLHDLRRFMRSGLARLGVSQVVAELCLGHQTAKGGLVGVYDQHMYVDEKRAAWQKWGDYVERLVRS